MNDEYHGYLTEAPVNHLCLCSGYDGVGRGLKGVLTICEQSLTWNGKDSQSQTWLRRLKRMKWMRLLFSRTLRPSHTTSFVDAWTCFLRDSHANPFPVVESATNQPKTQDTCTRGSQMELPLADQGLCCLRTSKESSRQRQETENPYLNMFLETWKKEVTERTPTQRLSAKIG